MSSIAPLVLRLYAEEEDREDIRNILAVRGAELDWDYLDRWATEHGTSALLAEIRTSIPSA